MCFVLSLVVFARVVVGASCVRACCCWRVLAFERVGVVVRVLLLARLGVVVRVCAGAYALLYDRCLVCRVQQRGRGGGCPLPVAVQFIKAEEATSIDRVESRV